MVIYAYGDQISNMAHTNSAQASHAHREPTDMN